MRAKASFVTNGNITVTRCAEEIAYSDTALQSIRENIDSARGAIFASGYEYPGRYSRWDIGFINPPIEFVSCGRSFSINPLNERGVHLLDMFHHSLSSLEDLDGTLEVSKGGIRGRVVEAQSTFPEEERLRQPTIFGVLRTLIDTFHSPNDPNLGFYGAFGYDLVFQFEPIKFRHERKESKSDLHLFMPDELFIIDHRLERAHRYEYDFASKKVSTEGLERTGEAIPFKKGVASTKTSDHVDGEYVEKVKEIVSEAVEGTFFEVVLSQKLSAGYTGTPNELFDVIRTANPSPYEFLINLGCEQLVGASPEMFVEVNGSQINTCPISGTIRRGKTPLEDAENVLELLNSSKDKEELTMCTDVDRNDKARVCKPGSVVVKEHRLIEKYSRLFHTVNPVVGELRPDVDALDGLLSHMWAGTLTGAPKHVAMQRIEDLENSERGWYGGCVGMLHFNGDVKTGITIRTVHLQNGIASVRAGSTLLAHSDPESEEKESQLKASAFMDAVLGKTSLPSSDEEGDIETGTGKVILLVDNDDSFVHTLGNYMRETGAVVITQRASSNGIGHEVLAEIGPDMVCISPGPGRPDDFKTKELVHACVDRSIPLFGVCLGLQGIVEAFGGTLGILEDPMHGVESSIHVTDTGVASGIFPKEVFVAGRYHSLYATSLPDCLEALAYSDDGIVMSVMHTSLPIAAVQFHPESLMTIGESNVGLTLIANVIKILTT